MNFRCFSLLITSAAVLFSCGAPAIDKDAYGLGVPVCQEYFDIVQNCMTRMGIDLVDVQQDLVILQQRWSTLDMNTLLDVCQSSVDSAPEKFKGVDCL